MKKVLASLALSAALCGAAHAQSTSNQGIGQGSYPPGATPVIASNTGTTTALTVNLNGQAGLKTYVCGFDIRAVATAAAVGNATLANVMGGNLNFTQFTATTSGPLVPLQENFSPCLPSSNTNTTIGVNAAAAGAGGVVSVAVWGYYAP